jgi:hypothetical protein
MSTRKAIEATPEDLRELVADWVWLAQACGLGRGIFMAGGWTPPIDKTRGDTARLWASWRDSQARFRRRQEGKKT